MEDNEQVTEQLSDLIIIVIGDNHCWGKGDTLTEAHKNASRPRQYVAYIAKPDTQVSEFDGALTWNRGFKPKVIECKWTKIAERLRSNGELK